MGGLSAPDWYQGSRSLRLMARRPIHLGSRPIDVLAAVVIASVWAQLTTCNLDKISDAHPVAVAAQREAATRGGPNSVSLLGIDHISGAPSCSVIAP